MNEESNVVEMAKGSEASSWAEFLQKHAVYQEIEQSIVLCGNHWHLAYAVPAKISKA